MLFFKNSNMPQRLYNTMGEGGIETETSYTQDLNPNYLAQISSVDLTYPNHSLFLAKFYHN